MQPNFQYISRTRFNKIPVVITQWWHHEHADHVHMIDFTWLYLVLADNYYAESLIPEITVMRFSQ